MIRPYIGISVLCLGLVGVVRADEFGYVQPVIVPAAPRTTYYAPSVSVPVTTYYAPTIVRYAPPPTRWSTYNSSVSTMPVGAIQTEAPITPVPVGAPPVDALAPPVVTYRPVTPVVTAPVIAAPAPVVTYRPVVVPAQPVVVAPAPVVTYRPVVAAPTYVVPQSYVVTRGLFGRPRLYPVTPAPIVVPAYVP